MLIHNMRDRRNDWVGTFECEPLVYDALTERDIGRTVVYRKSAPAEAGILTSWKGGLVFARYGKGDTAAGSKPENLLLVIE